MADASVSHIELEISKNPCISKVQFVEPDRTGKLRFEPVRVKILRFQFGPISYPPNAIAARESVGVEWIDPADAFAIDNTNLFQKLGLQTFLNLSTNFYNRVYDDEEEWFRTIFAGSKKEDAIQNQYDFFAQRMGGPSLYSERRGHPALIGRHRPFPVTRQAAERWLHHMQNALDTTPDIDDDSKIKMMNFFRHTAYFLVAGDDLKNESQKKVCKKQGACNCK